jgi:hypothetical protein
MLTSSFHLVAADACGAHPNEVLSGRTCTCTTGNIKNTQGICCPPHAAYSPQQSCYCDAAGTVFEGTGCCPINSVWQGSVSSGECVCAEGYAWDGQICKSCTPFLQDSVSLLKSNDVFAHHSSGFRPSTLAVIEVVNAKVICPDGPLNTCTLAALPDNGTTKPYIQHSAEECRKHNHMYVYL